MLDFAALSQARQGLQKNQNQRHEQSKQLYQQGRDFIRDAFIPPINKTKFKQAVDCFSKGIQCNFKNADNYWGMGFLFLSLNQPLKSIPYLKSGLEIETQSRLGQALLQQAQSGLVSVGQKNNIEKQTHSSDPYLIDFDQLYEETATSILGLLKQLLSTMPMDLSLDSKNRGFLDAQYQAYQTQFETFTHELQILDAEIDVSDLALQMASVQRKLKQMKDFMALQSLFLNIHDQIENEVSVLNQQIELIGGILNPSALKGWDESLQAMLDQCDLIADRLDDLSARNVDISLLEQAYTKYVARLSYFQELLEDH